MDTAGRDCLDERHQNFKNNCLKFGKGWLITALPIHRCLPGNISYFINGIKASKEDTEELDPMQVRPAAVLKGAVAVRKYKSDGRNGVLEIALKTRYALASFNVERTMFFPPGTPE